MISVFLWIGKLMIANGNWSIGTPVRNLFDEKNGYKYIYIYEKLSWGELGWDMVKNCSEPDGSRFFRLNVLDFEPF